MLPKWQPIMSFSFLVVILIVLWAASQGKFTKKLKQTAECVIDSRSQENCEPYKKEIQRLNGVIIEQQQRIDTLAAQNAELSRKVNDLMNEINRLTNDLAAAKTENARLKAALKAAVEDLAACRRSLAQCRAELLAKRVTDATCKLQPENANLLR